MQRMYETIFILHPDLGDDEVRELTSKIEQTVASLNGDLKQIVDWGMRKLAYPINKVSRGRYWYMRLDGSAEMIAEVERRLRLNDRVLRYQSVRLEKELPPAPVKSVPVEETEAAVETSDAVESTEE